MKRRLLKALPIISLAMMIFFAQAGIALAVNYYLSIKVSSAEGTPDYASLPFAVDINNQKLAELGYISESGLDTRVTYGGSELKHMVASDKLAFVASEVKGGIDYDYSYTMGNVALDAFSIIPGHNGYVSIPDSADLELGSGFSVEQKGYVDTSSGSDKNLVYKQGAFQSYVPAVANITSRILSDNAWVDVYSGSLVADAWVEQTFTECFVSQVRAALYVGSSTGNEGRLYEIEVWDLDSASWVSPTSVIDDGGRWVDPTNAYDANTTTCASFDAGDAVSKWYEFLTLGQPYLRSDKLRYFAGGFNANSIDVDIFASTVAASVTATGISSGEHTVKTTESPALSFDGVDDYVDCGNGASLNPTDEVTVIAWLNPNFSADTFYGIVSKFGGMPPGWQFYWNSAQYLYFYANDGVAATSVTNVLANGVWQHVAVTLKSDSTSKSKIYVNAVDKTNSVSSRTLQANDVNLVIGAQSGNKNDPFNGLIDEVFVYDRALTSLEITEHYNGIYSDETDLVGHWKFGEGTGTTTVDSSGNGNDGTINSATWTTGALKLYVDNTLEDIVDGASIPDNANDWILMQNNSMPYMEYYKHTVGGNLTTWYQPNTMISGTTLPDREGTAQDGTITWGSLPSGISTTLGELRIISLQQISPEAEKSAYLELFGNVPPEPERLYDADNYNAIPGAEVINELATAGQIPLKLFWVPMVFIIAIGMGLIIYSKTRSILAVAIAAGAVIGFFWTVGMLPWWIFVPYAIMSVAMCVQEKTYGF